MKEFAELLTDVDPSKIDGYNNVEAAIYAEEVEPYIRMIINWIEVQDLTSPEDDDIPF